MLKGLSPYITARNECVVVLPQSRARARAIAVYACFL